MVLSGIPATASLAGAAEPVGLAINEDNSHFYGGRAGDDMTLDGLHAWVDQYADTKASHLFLCPNAMRASYRSKAFDPIWELGSQKMPESGHGKSWVENARLLDERGLDPYAVWIARCREKGISPWLTMRMNDVHDVSDTTSFMHSTFWVDHPEYWRVPGGTGSWVERAFDYGVPEVREHHMGFIRELLERYDPDGLELDWMRFGYHFKPGRETEGAEILTGFVREVRELTNAWSEKRGHSIKLGARVPTHPDAAKGLGMDGVRWAREGLVDMLVPTPFWSACDFDIPIELWRQRIGPAADEIVLAAGLESNLRAYPGAKQTPNDIASVRGFAAASLHRGADQIYLFNYMDPAPMHGGPEAYRALLDKGLGLDVVARAQRRHVVCYRDTVPDGVSNGVALPVEGRNGGTFRIYTGPVPEDGRVLFVAGLAGRAEAAQAEFDVSLNDKQCKPIADFDNPVQFPGAARAARFDCPLAAMREGYNEVRITQRAGRAEQQIVWAELRIDTGVPRSRRVQPLTLNARPLNHTGLRISVNRSHPVRLGRMALNQSGPRLATPHLVWRFRQKDKHVPAQAGFSDTANRFRLTRWLD